MDAWARSGLTLEEFGRRHDVGAAKLGWWKRRLESETSESIALVPMVATTSMAAVTVRIGAVEVEVRDPAVVTPAWLAELVSDLASRSRA